MGYLYRPKLKRKPGTPPEKAKSSRIFWCKYYANGRGIGESTGTEKEQEARRFLKAREGAVATGQPVFPRVDRIRYEEIAVDLKRHYEASGTRDLVEYAYRVKHAGRLRPLPHRQPGRSPGCRPEARGHVFGHVGGGRG